jgi:hypothetical protein
MIGKPSYGMNSQSLSISIVPPSNANVTAGDIINALQSLQEEIEAARLYKDRLTRLTNPELGLLIQHNLEEELEHCAMLIEWLRKYMAIFDKKLKEKLYNPTYIKD